jgi:hypothetical protein
METILNHTISYGKIDKLKENDPFMLEVLCENIDKGALRGFV